MLAAAVLFAVGMLVLASVAEPAGAAFPGTNGKVAFAKFGPRSDKARIFSVNPDGSEQMNLGPGFSPSYSPGGRKIVFSSYRFSESPGGEEFEEDAEISVINVSGTGRKDLTSGPALDLAPVFSPNGERIAFTRVTFSSRSEEADIFLMRDDGTGVRQLTDTRAFEFGPDWQSEP